MQKNDQRMMNNNTFLVFDEDMEKTLEFKNNITLCEKKMNKFFVENPELRNQLNLDENKKTDKEKSILDGESEIFKLLQKDVYNNYKLDDVEGGNLKKKLEII